MDLFIRHEAAVWQMVSVNVAAVRQTRLALGWVTYVRELELCLHRLGN